jgi:hypothetical protein
MFSLSNALPSGVQTRQGYDGTAAISPDIDTVGNEIM